MSHAVTRRCGMVAVLLLALTLGGCAQTRAVPDAPASPHATWRCVLLSRDGRRTVHVVELPKLFPMLALTDCDQSRVAQIRFGVATDIPRICGALEQRRRLFRFVSLDVDAMTATYRALEP